MAIIHISSSDPNVYKDFSNSNPVQVRVNVSQDEQNEYEKGKTVKVVHDKDEASAKIVSEPLEINHKAEDGSKVLSLIIQKV